MNVKTFPFCDFKNQLGNNFESIAWNCIQDFYGQLRSWRSQVVQMLCSSDRDGMTSLDSKVS